MFNKRAWLIILWVNVDHQLDKMFLDEVWDWGVMGCCRFWFDWNFSLNYLLEFWNYVFDYDFPGDYRYFYLERLHNHIDLFQLPPFLKPQKKHPKKNSKTHPQKITHPQQQIPIYKSFTSQNKLNRFINIQMTPTNKSSQHIIPFIFHNQKSWHSCNFIFLGQLFSFFNI